MPMTHTNSDMLERLKAGSEQAFQHIYKCYWEKVFITACQKLRNPHEAEEIAQEIFLDLWKRRESLDIAISLNAYLAAAVKYKVIDKLAERNRQLRIQREIQSTESDNSTLAWLSFEDLQEQLMSAVALLPEKCRMVFTLSRHEGLTHKQIAEQLGIAEKTVESHLSRALRSLRSSLQSLFSFF